MKTKLKILFSVFSAITFCAPSTHAMSTGDSFGLSPFWDWKQIETEHFRVVFPAPLTAQAKKVTEIYEQAHADLKKDLRWEPRNRVNVLVIDNSDAANGLTTPISRFGMLLYLTPPDPFFSTDAYDDWLRLLIYHEYTHFLNMDATRGIWGVGRYIFGDIFLPNSAWPPWMLEGYAVYNETKYTKTGRGRSPYWESVLRTIVEENALDRSDTVTLDKINGEFPRFPSGEVPYLFGYHLMNTVERSRKDALGEMTERSSYRFPYFINGNVENITGKDWYGHWDAWVAETNTRMQSQLSKLRSAPVSKVERFDGTYDSSFGVAFSPDLRWAAYSTQSPDRWQTLRLREWKTGAKPREIEDKFLGSTLAFTRDSKRVVYSSLHRRSNYYTESDLRVYDLESEKTYWLTSGERARDPDLSRDGNRVVYTVAHDSGTDLMVGSLSENEGKLAITGARKVVDVPAYDRIATPRFTADGTRIVFAWKQNGKPSEELYEVASIGGTPKAIVSDGSRNRFPAFDSRGALYFVSDRTGVDNLYRRDSGKDLLVTNVTGALWLPSFRGNDLYASVLSRTGFSLARVELFPNGIDPAKVKLKIAEEAPAAAPIVPPAPHAEYTVENYSALGTLLPRQWAPLFLGDANSTYVGAEVAGYDNTFRHQYFVLGAFDTTARAFDYAFQYENRVLGPSVNLYSSNLTKDVRTSKTNGGLPASFTREFQVGGSISFPFQHMVSTFTPKLGASVEKNAFYDMPAGATRLYSRDRAVPRQDLLLTYANTRRSRLGVTSERGNTTDIGVRRYDLGARDLFKGIFEHAQYLNLGKHVVLAPSLRAMKVSRRDFSYLDASALSRGKRDRFLAPFYSDSFDEFSIRGYPNMTFSSTEAVTLAADLKFPIAPIFRGFGTNPLFFDQLAMQLFAEDTYRPSAVTRTQHLASAGAGLRLGVEALLVLPLTFGVDYHYGFNKDASGQGEVFVSLTAASLLPF